MTLEEIIKSDIELTEDLIKKNNITSSSLNENVSIETDEERKRKLDVLFILENLYPYDYDVKFNILYSYACLGEYETMLEYAKNIRNTGHFKADASLIILIIETILGKSPGEAEEIGLNEILVKPSQYNGLTFPANIRKLIYYKHFNEARAAFGAYSGNKEVCIQGVAIMKVLTNLCKKIRNQVLEDIDNLNILGLDDYYKTIKEPKRIDNLQMELVDVLNAVASGLPMPKKVGESKPDNIYDAMKKNDFAHISLNCGKTNSVITQKLADKIIEVNQKNIESSFSTNDNSYLNYILEVTYNCFDNGDIETLLKTMRKYLIDIDRLEWEDLLRTLILKTQKETSTLIGEEYEERLANVTEFIISLSKPLTKKGTLYLEKEIKNDFGDNEKVHPYSDIYKLDIDYNYGIDNVKELLNKFLADDTTFVDDLNQFSYEDSLYATALVARECYRTGRFNEGDDFIAMVKEHIKLNVKEFQELSKLIRLITDYKESLYYQEHESFTETIKRLVREDV
ncbi:MAG: hypothetical protein J1F35_01985 [Erysipelotrichales bacterium]|nr:hypothetical protein [Erysipelotrichales bacterium]